MDWKLKPIIFYIFLFLFIAAISIATIENYDYDLWARLIAGMHIVQTGHVLKFDFLSYTPTHIWYDHEWGSSVIFYLTQHYFNGAGILILQTILIFSIFFVTSKVVKLRGVSTTSPYNFLFYFFTLSTISYIIMTPIRCQLFSFLFFAIFIYILERARKEIGSNLELYISLPMLMVIWNNMHGGSISGIGLILIYIIGEFLNRKPVKKYIYTLTLALLVLPMNPWGFDYLKFLFNAVTMKRPDVVEWWGIFSTYNIHNYIKLKLFLIVFVLLEIYLIFKAFLNRNYNFDKTKFLVLLVTLIQGIQHVKLMPLFVISAVCFLYSDFYEVFNKITFNIFNKIASIKDFFVYTIIAIYIVGNLVHCKLKPAIDFNKYPVLSVEFIKINKLKGKLLTNFGFGSYVSYKLYPQNKIFMDGRYEEVYYDFMMPLLKKFHLMTPGWDEILKKYPPDVMILENMYPIYPYLAHSKDWKLIYDKDFSFGVFVKTKDVKENYKQPIENIDYYRQRVFETDINFSGNNERKN